MQCRSKDLGGNFGAVGEKQPTCRWLQVTQRPNGVGHVPFGDETGEAETNLGGEVNLPLDKTASYGPGPVVDVRNVPCAC